MSLNREIKSITVTDPNFKIQFEDGIDSECDIRCYNSELDICIEIQQQNRPYLLHRTQEYISKMISTQVKKKDSQNYHKVMKSSFVLSFGLENYFTGSKALKNDYNKNFLKTFNLHSVELNEDFPDNVITLNFFELSKFKKFFKKKSIQKTTPMLHQWLYFLSYAHRFTHLPSEMFNETIIKAFHLLYSFKLDENNQFAYFNIFRKEQDKMDFIESLKATSYRDGVDIGFLKGKVKGDKEGVIKLEIHFIKSYLNDGTLTKYEDRLKILSRNNYPEHYEKIIELCKSSIEDIDLTNIDLTFEKIKDLLGQDFIDKII
jgi:predicted transposase/invertase (TIGR01784 family)